MKSHAHTHTHTHSHTNTHTYKSTNKVAYTNYQVKTKQIQQLKEWEIMLKKIFLRIYSHSVLYKVVSFLFVQISVLINFTIVRNHHIGSGYSPRLFCSNPRC